MRSKAIALDLASLAVLIGAILFVMAPFLSNRVVPFAADEGGSDLLDLNVPHRLLLWEGIRSGELPLWSSDISTGFPLLAEAQTGILDPLQYLVFRTLPFVLAFNLRLVLALVIMAIGTFYYAKRVGLGQLGALLVAVSFTFSGYSLGHFKHVQILDSVAYFPWVLLAVESIVRNRAKGWSMLLGGSIGLSALAGHLPTTVFLAFGATAYFIVRLITDRSAPRERGSPYVALVAGLLLGILIAAVQILPSVDFIRESTRQVGTGFLGLPTFHPRFLLTLISPWFLGDPSQGTYDIEGDFSWWENAFTVGIGALLLAIIAFRRRRSPRSVLPNAILGALGFLMVLGPATSLIPRLLWFGFPGLTLTRVPSRFLFLVSWALAVLAGFGAERLLAAVRARSPRWSVPVGGVVAAAVTVPLLLMFHGYYTPWPMEQLRTPPPTVRWLTEHSHPFDRFITQGFESAWADAWRQAHGWRQDIAPYESVNALLRPDLALYSGVTNASFPNEYRGAFSVARRAQLGGATEQAGIEQPYAPKLLGLSTVRYLLTPQPLNERAAKNFLLAATIDIPGVGPVRTVSVYENPSYTPRYELVGTLKETNPERGALFQLTEDDFDPKETALVETVPPGWTNHALGSAGVDSVVERNRSVELQVHTQTPALLVAADTYAPGWTATVDGQRAPILRTNYAFRGVTIPAGTHVVRFLYRPASFRWGAAISLGTTAFAVLAAGYAGVRGWRSRQRRVPPRRVPAPR